MVKKPVLINEEADALNKIKKALNAWHVDRKEWVDRAMRLMLLVNSGAAIAVAAFIGSTLATPREWSTSSPLLMLFISFACFLVAILLVVGYNVYRYFWAEYRVWYLRGRRAELLDDEKQLNLKCIKTQHPPTRPQLWLTYVLNGLGTLLFVVGIALGFVALVKIVTNSNIDVYRLAKLLIDLYRPSLPS